MTSSARWFSRLGRLGPHLAHAAVAVGLFGEAVWGQRVLFFRDLGTSTLPQYVVLARGLSQGLWPLWNPFADGGRPLLSAYPPELVALALLEPSRALGLMVLVHLALAMSGMTLLARHRGASAWSAWLAGAAFGLSGTLLSLVNLLPLFLAAAWAPWVVLAWGRLSDAPSLRNANLFGVAAALQVSTLGFEVGLQTALLGLLLWPPSVGRARWLFTALGASLAALMSAPAWLGVAHLMGDTVRARGFEQRSALAFSMHPMTLLDALLPRFFGDVHTMTDWGYWGQAYFPEGFPYLLSVYLGLPVLLLALRGASRDWRLFVLAVLALLLALGHNGPLLLVWRPLALVSRTPVKFFFLVTACVSLLAAAGCEHALRQSRRSWWWMLPGALLIALALLVPASFALAEPYLRFVALRTWPMAFATAGICALLVELGCQRTRPALVAAPAVLELLLAHAGLNVFATSDFLRLEPSVAALTERMRVEPGRVFAYAGSEQPLTYAPTLLKRNRDLPLYYTERQLQSPEWNAFSGLEAALGEDRTGFAPVGATFEPAFRRPELFRPQYPWLRLAGVRWVLSCVPLPPDLVEPVASARVSTVAEPLRLYRLRQALGAAFFSPRAWVEPDRGARQAAIVAAGFDPTRAVPLATPLSPAATPAPSTSSAATIRTIRLNLHTVRVEADTPAGLVVLTDGFNASWRVRGAAGPLRLARALDRGMAFETNGGRQAFLLEFAPRWRPLAVVLSALGVLGAVAAGVWAGRSPARLGAGGRPERPEVAP